jgi:hypothetical protein
MEEGAHGRVNELTRIMPIGVDGELARIEAGQVDQVIGPARDDLRGAGDVLSQLLPLGRGVRE